MSASNLDSSHYNIAMEMRDVENTQQNVESSPSKVCLFFFLYVAVPHIARQCVDVLYLYIFVGVQKAVGSKPRN